MIFNFDFLMDIINYYLSLIHLKISILPVEAKLMWKIRNESSREELKHNAYEALQKIK